MKLTAETAPDANNLLRQYVAFASQRAAGHLNDELKGARAARTVQMKAQVKRRGRGGARDFQSPHAQRGTGAESRAAAQHLPQRNRYSTRSAAGFRAVLLGRPMLQARLENLQAVGPQYDLDYDQSRAMLTTLNVGPTLDPRFQTYRYLRTPEEPVKRDSPRRVFLMVMWGLWARSSAQALRYRVAVSSECGLW